MDLSYGCSPKLIVSPVGMHKSNMHLGTLLDPGMNLRALEITALDYV
jgi:hypothetical protein